MPIYGFKKIYNVAPQLQAPNLQNDFENEEVRVNLLDPNKDKKWTPLAVIIDSLIITGLAGAGIFLLLKAGGVLHVNLLNNALCAKLGGGLLGGGILILSFDVITKIVLEVKISNHNYQLAKQQQNQNVIEPKQNTFILEENKENEVSQLRQQIEELTEMNKKLQLQFQEQSVNIPKEEVISVEHDQKLPKNDNLEEVKPELSKEEKKEESGKISKFLLA